MKIVKKIIGGLFAGFLILLVIGAVAGGDATESYANDDNSNKTNINAKQLTNKVESKKETKTDEQLQNEKLLNEELGYFDRVDFNYKTNGEITADPYMEGKENTEGYVTFVTFMNEYIGRDYIENVSSYLDDISDKGYSDMYEYCLDRKNGREVVFRCRLKYVKPKEGKQEPVIYATALLRPLVDNKPMSDDEINKMMTMEPFTQLHRIKEDGSDYKDYFKCRSEYQPIEKTNS